MDAITWTPARVKLGDLKPWGHNPRQSTKKQAQRIVASFSEFGQVQTVAIGPDNEVYDGHQRLSALLTLHGKGYEIDARRASRALTDDERKRLVLMLHAGASGEWNWDLLSAWDSSLLQDSGIDKDLLAMLNRDAAAVIELLAEVNSDAPLATDAEWGEGFGGLPTEDRAPFQQMTFTLHDEQAAEVKAAVKLALKMGDFADNQNKNGNGNALALICETFVTQHGNG